MEQCSNVFAACCLSNLVSFKDTKGGGKVQLLLVCFLPILKKLIEIYHFVDLAEATKKRSSKRQITPGEDERVYRWKLNNLNYILDIVWKIGIFHQDTKHLLFEGNLFVFTFYQGFLNNLRDIFFGNLSQRYMWNLWNLLDLVLLCVQDLKKSGSGRCVILGTVTATVNGAELGGMIPPLAHVGALIQIEIESFENSRWKWSQSLDGFQSSI